MAQDQVLLSNPTRPTAPSPTPTGRRATAPLSQPGNRKVDQQASHLQTPRVQRHPYGGKIRLETHILQHLSKRNPAPTGSEFLVSTRRLDNVVRITQHQATKIGTTACQDYEITHQGRLEGVQSSHQVLARERERAERQEHGSGFVSNQDPGQGFQWLNLWSNLYWSTNLIIFLKFLLPFAILI